MNNITMISTIGRNNEIGFDDYRLIWNYKKNIDFLEKNVNEKTLIMGLNTYYTFINFLKNKDNIVLSHNDINIKGARILHSKDEVLNLINSSDKEYMIIGGEKVYNEFINDADKLLITQIDDSCSGADKYFPSIDENVWNEELIDETNEKNIKLKFLKYTRR